MDDEKFLHLTEKDPHQVARSRQAYAAVMRRIKREAPDLIPELEAGNLLFALLYDEHATAQACFAITEKYQKDAVPCLVVLARTPEIGLIYGMVLRPLPGRGTKTEILTRQMGVDVPGVTLMEPYNARPV